ncbi:MAG: di-heme oxidoredictase family protein [Pseudomonadota bacterium]
MAERDVLALQDPSDRDHDGISGRANRVWDASAKTLALGRFGWKAEQPSVLQQAAVAFVSDLGITSSLLPDENHSLLEAAAAQQPSGGSPEVRDDILKSVALYARSLAVPARRSQANPAVIAGEELFRVMGCASCHVATWKTAPVADLNWAFRASTPIPICCSRHGRGVERWPSNVRGECSRMANGSALGDRPRGEGQRTQFLFARRSR